MIVNIDQVLTRAKSFERRGQFLEAQRLYHKVLKSYPANKRIKKALSELPKCKQVPLPSKDKLDSLMLSLG